jgi:hypothetical protein
VTRAFRIHEKDNVATLLGDAAAGPVEVHGAGANGTVRIGEPISLGHKVALRPIANGEAVIKFGVAIGVASRLVEKGEWVHLHNCRSRFDERSGEFDPVTGTARDTRYG